MAAEFILPLLGFSRCNKIGEDEGRGWKMRNSSTPMTHRQFSTLSKEELWKCAILYRQHVHFGLLESLLRVFGIQIGIPLPSNIRVTEDSISQMRLAKLRN